MTSRSTSRRMAIIGAGPIGLEAALIASQRGFDVQVFERGRVGDNLRDWGHVRLFSPFGMNASPRARQAIAASDSEPLPSDSELLSGHEFFERYLLPLSRLPELAGCIREGVEVVSVGRSHTWKQEKIGRPERADDPFRLLLNDGRGEQILETDIVLDCSGTYPHHNWVGAGGMPSIGERSALMGTDYRLPDVRNRDRERFAGRKTLVIGAGYSAATAVVELARLAENAAGTQVVWLTRGRRSPPVERIPGDRLEERDRLAAAANRLALADESPVDWQTGSIVQIERTAPEGDYRVQIEGPNCDRPRTVLSVDRVIANVGYRPERRLYEELQIHECYATGGPIKLAASLLGETSTDCLDQPGQGIDVLKNPEPGFFILGSKSYGRDSRFLLKTGHQQIEDLFDLL